MAEEGGIELSATDAVAEQTIADVFKQKSEEVLSSLPPLAPEKQQKSLHAIQAVGRLLPEATLVGGWALRLHL